MRASPPNSLKNARVPILGIVAIQSNSGKTTLLEKLIALLGEDELRVGVIKHVHHNFDMDREGKDSYRFRKAGSSQVMMASDRRWALLMENDDVAQYPDLDELIVHMDQTKLDLLLVEGLRDYAFTKIEVTLEDSAEGLLCHDDPHIIAVAGKVPLQSLPVSWLPIDEPEKVATFIKKWMMG
jgi:molybdopterin-guanine dinucleotide biosynthesis protein MobB|tara:strand:+ start:1414 stop:1959 length:546 start_codon:yes stop_codon:yes gene_type:complete